MSKQDQRQSKNSRQMIATEQKTAFVVSLVLAGVALVLLVIPGLDGTSRVWLAGTIGKIAIVTFMLSVGWVPLRRIWSLNGGKAVVIAVLICILVAAFRPRAVFVVFPIVIIGAGMYMALAWGERFFKKSK
jgi:cation transport ATPase